MRGEFNLCLNFSLYTVYVWESTTPYSICELIQSLTNTPSSPSSAIITNTHPITYNYSKNRNVCQYISQELKLSTKAIIFLLFLENRFSETVRVMETWQMHYLDGAYVTMKWRCRRNQFVKRKIKFSFRLIRRHLFIVPMQ